MAVAERSIPVPGGTLAKWRASAREMNRAAQSAYLAVTSGRALAGGVPVADKLREVFEGAGKLTQSIGVVAGPDTMPDFEHAIELAQMNTPDTRRLLDLLTEALVVAERVDAARGRSVGLDAPLGEDEPAGCDLAESIGLIRLRVKEEVLGAGPGRE